MSLPIGLARLLGKIESFRNPQFSNRELGMLQRGVKGPEDALKVAQWAAQEARKPLNPEMNRRQFLGTLAEMPARAKKAEIMLTAPQFEADRQRLENLAWSRRTDEPDPLDYLDVYHGIYDDNPELKASVIDELEKKREQHASMRAEVASLRKALLENPSYDAIRAHPEISSPNIWDEDLHGVPDLSTNARGLLSERLRQQHGDWEGLRPWQHPDYPGRHFLDRKDPNETFDAWTQRHNAFYEAQQKPYQAWEDSLTAHIDTETKAIQEALRRELDAIDVSTVTPPPEPAAPPPPPAPPPAPETPSFFSAYKKRFRLK